MDGETQTLAILFVLGATSIFFIIIAAGILFGRRDNRGDRVRLVTMQADAYEKLKQEQSSRHQARLRQKMQASIKFMRVFLERFQLQRLAASKNLKLRLAAAGLRHPSAPITFVFSRFVSAAGAVFLALLIAGLSSEFNPSAPAHILIAIGAAIAGYYLPAILIKNWTQKRQQSMTLAFPDMLDIMVICVESGLSIDAAFSRVTEEIIETSPVLSRELALLSAEWTGWCPPTTAGPPGLAQPV